MASETWYLLNSGRGAAAFNMAVDEALLEAMPRLNRPVLRFYGWTVFAASFGYFQKYREVESLTPLRPLVRRPTAGGIVPHDADWTYSLAFPAGHAWHGLRAAESYFRVHDWIRSAFGRLGFATVVAPMARKAGAGQCFLGYEQSDLLWCGDKIAGAAQRRTRAGLLIQGSVQCPAAPFAREAWQRAMCEAASESEGIRWEPLVLDADLNARVAELSSKKYSAEPFNRKR